MGLKCRGKFGAVGFQHRDIVLDRHGVVHLAAKALGGDAGANAFAGGIHRGRCTGRATTDDQHVIRRLRAEFGRVARRCTGVKLGNHFFEQDAARVEHLAVQKHHRHRHDLALVDFVLEGAAFDDHGLDLGVEHRHQRQRLHHVGAVVAAQRHVDLKVVVTVECLDLVDHILLDLGRVAAGPEQRQHQGGELVAQRQAGKTQAAGTAGAL